MFSKWDANTLDRALLESSFFNLSLNSFLIKAFAFFLFFHEPSMFPRTSRALDQQEFLLLSNLVCKITKQRDS